MKMRGVIIVLIIGLFSLLGCDYISGLFNPKPKKEAAVAVVIPADAVARVGNLFITADDLKKAVDTYNASLSPRFAQDKLDTKEKKIDYLRNYLVSEYILYQEALERGLDKREDMAKAIENKKIEILVTELLREEMEKLEVSDKEIEDFYNQNKDNPMLKRPEQRRVFEIVTDTEDTAKQAYIELLKGTDFAAIAKQYSKAKSAADGGDLGYVSLEADPRKRVKFDKFYEVTFSPSTEPGAVSTIFKGPDGYYIVKVDTIRKSETKPLSELREDIKTGLLREKQQKALSDLTGKVSSETKIEVYEGKVE